MVIGVEMTPYPWMPLLTEKSAAAGFLMNNPMKGFRG